MTLTVGTFNARHGRPPRGLARLDLLVRQCASLETDVLGLQEVDRHVVRSWFADQPRRIARGLDARHAWSPARRPLVIGHEGNALVVRGELAEVSTVELPDSPRHYRRALLLARVHIGEVALSVAVTHLHNETSVARRQLPVVLSHLDARPGPHVLLGDLNLRPPDVVPVLTDAGYAVAEAGPTVPAHAPDEQIDFVATRGATVEDAWVATTVVSDHRPLITRLDVPVDVTSR